MNKLYKNSRTCLHNLQKRPHAKAKHNGQYGVKGGTIMLRGRTQRASTGGTK